MKKLILTTSLFISSIAFQTPTLWAQNLRCSPQWIDIDTCKQFLALWQNDNHFITDKTNIFVQQNKPKKLGIVIQNTELWEQREFLSPTIVDNFNIDGSKYTLFARAVWNKNAHPQIGGWNDYIAAYTSNDGINFHRPNIGKVEFAQSTQNNLMYPRGFGLPFFDSTAQEGQRWQRLRRYYDANSGNYGGGAVGVEYTNDVLDAFTPSNPANVSIHRTLDGSNQAYFDKKINKYVVYIRSWTHNGSQQALSFSVNNAKGYENFGRCVTRLELTPQQYFGNWHTPAGWDLFGNGHLAVDATLSTPIAKTVLKPINNQIDVYESGFFAYKEATCQGYPQAFFMLGTHFDAQNVRFLGGYLAVSRDNNTWHRVDSLTPYIGIGTGNDADAGQVITGFGYIKVGDSLLQYYSGTTTNSGNHDMLGSKIFATKQRLDGFVSVDAQHAIGELITKNIKTSAQFLFINAMTTQPQGEILIELLDQNCVPIKGFTFADAVPITQNNIGQQIRWNKHQNIGSIAGKMFKIHIKMRHAKIFSFQCRNDGQTLPFEFRDVEAKPATAMSVVVKWTTRWEQDIRKYELQRQINNENFYSIADFNANTSHDNRYNHTDKEITSHELYQKNEPNTIKYRVKIIDMLGKARYSDSLTILNLNNTDAQKKIKIFPTVANNILNIKIIDDQDLMPFEGVLNDLTGKTVSAQPLISNIDNQIDISHCSNGVYVIQIKNELKEIVYQDKIIISN